MGCVDIRMTKPYPYHVNVVASLNQMHGRGMPKCMWANSLAIQGRALQRCLLRVTSDNVTHAKAGKWFSISVKEKLLTISFHWSAGADICLNSANSVEFYFPICFWI